MNCQTINQLTAWACSKAQGVHGEEASMLVPPVRFSGGAVVPVYVFDRGGQFEITDDGGLLESLHVSGVKVGGDKRRIRGLEAALARWDVAVSNGELQVWSKPDTLAFSLQRYLGAMFSAAQWQFENLGRTTDGQPVMEEAELYLRALNPHSQISRNSKLSAVSGTKQNFPLKVDETYFDAMSLHPASTAATVKKLFDVRNVRANLEIQITMIVDDRDDDQRTKGDLNMVSILAHVQSFTALRDSAAKALLQH
jgi:Domain of unknown function DUF1828